LLQSTLSFTTAEFQISAFIYNESFDTLWTTVTHRGVVYGHWLVCGDRLCSLYTVDPLCRIAKKHFCGGMHNFVG
jgi:hypothetical protein